MPLHLSLLSAPFLGFLKLQKCGSVFFVEGLLFWLNTWAMRGETIARGMGDQPHAQTLAHSITFGDSLCRQNKCICWPDQTLSQGEGTKILSLISPTSHLLLALLLRGLNCLLILKTHVHINSTHFCKLIYSVKGAFSNKMSHFDFLNYQEKEGKAQRG